MSPPRIGITSDFDGERCIVAIHTARRVERAGGLPVHLPCLPSVAATCADRLDGFVFTGGDDPIMERWGVPTHSKARPVHPDRQAFELALLEALIAHRERPVLGICLGMQMMSLHAGGRMDQHMPDTDAARAARHWGRLIHRVTGDLGWGAFEAPVQSHHRQAIVDAGRLSVCGMSDDGVIEAVRDPARPFYLGVQWHPERTDDHAGGQAIFEQFMRTCSERSRGAAHGPAATPPAMARTTKMM